VIQRKRGQSEHGTTKDESSLQLFRQINGADLKDPSAGQTCCTAFFGCSQAMDEALAERH
jgi:hypothetical protein